MSLGSAVQKTESKKDKKYIEDPVSRTITQYIGSGILVSRLR